MERNQKNFQYSVFKNTSVIDEDLLKKVKDLFNSYYFSYHYINELMKPDRINFICSKNDSVIGYASIKEYMNIAFFSNLLVQNKYQNNGIGSNLELLRYNYTKKEKKSIYSSCMTNTLASQKLKEKLGLSPLNYKYGYRQQVFNKNSISSAVTYVSKGKYEMGLVRHNRSLFNNKLKRLRIISNSYSYIHSQLKCLRNYDDLYIDVLTSVQNKKPIKNEGDEQSILELQGFELDFTQTPIKMLLLFQVKNNIYYKGFNQKNFFFRNIKELNNNYADKIKSYKNENYLKF